MYNPVTDGRSSRSLDSLFRSLSSARRREILRIVDGASPDGIAKDDLAFRLAAVTDDDRFAAVTQADYQRALTACHHRDLPALSDAGLLEVGDDGTVATTDHWVFDDPWFDGVLGGRRPDGLDAVFEALADSRRRSILAVLAEGHRPISTRTLARDVAAHEADSSERDVSADRVDGVLGSLVHVHLPMLSDAGLVDYDADEDRVAYEGHPLLGSRLDRPDAQREEFLTAILL